MKTLDYTDNQAFRTTSFYAAAYLFAKGVELLGIDRSNSRRSQFIFKDNSERETVLQQFNFAKENAPEVMIDARKFVMAIKMLKERLYQEGD